MKFLFAGLASAVLLAKPPLFDRAAQLSAGGAPSAEQRLIGLQLLANVSGGLVVSAIPTVLSVYKSPGLTHH